MHWPKQLSRQALIVSVVFYVAAPTQALYGQSRYTAPVAAVSAAALAEPSGPSCSCPKAPTAHAHLSQFDFAISRVDVTDFVVKPAGNQSFLGKVVGICK